MTAPVSGKQIGRSLPRLEARAKVSGRAEYTHIMRLPGMLTCKIFRSTVPHGRIKSIDVAAARKVPGVYAVYTGEDIRKVIPDPYYGPAFHDQPILALNKVHYVGEPVAAVLADDAHVADQAVQQIAAEYEELPAVFDELEAADNKVLVHQELKPATTFADLKHLKGVKGTNCALDFKLRRGDADKAFASAAHVFEHTFKTQKVLHLAFEPFASIADYKDDGVTIYTASQSPSFVRTEIARLLGWPENRVRVKVPFLGGGYGGKLYIKLEAMAVALAMLARHVPHQDRHRQERQNRRAQMRRLVERRRLCRCRAAGDAEIGFHRVGPLRHRQRRDRFLRALYQSAAGRRLARFRHPATGVGL
jgi:CO/xanthine dehydrogenase Mo-binding subunit